MAWRVCWSTPASRAPRRPTFSTRSLVTSEETWVGARGGGVHAGYCGLEVLRVADSVLRGGVHEGLCGRSPGLDSKACQRCRVQQTVAAVIDRRYSKRNLSCGLADGQLFVQIDPAHVSL